MSTPNDTVPLLAQSRERRERNSDEFRLLHEEIIHLQSQITRLQAEASRHLPDVVAQLDEENRVATAAGRLLVSSPGGPGRLTRLGFAFTGGTIALMSWLILRAIHRVTADEEDSDDGDHV
jgi:hypothetical protein